MMSLSRISPAQASSYFTKDDYYTKEQGQWQGHGAGTLGLVGDVEKEVFKRLIQGQGHDGAPLVSSQNGKEHRAGLDLTFSAPKSISILSEIVCDQRVREAHQNAVSRTLAFAEKYLSQARQTEMGITQKIDTGNLVIAKFDHETSRTLDPQLHTHAVVMNMTQRPDRAWRALSNEKLYKHKLLLGQVYRNDLAHRLIALGYGIQAKKNGLFEAEGIDTSLIKAFSLRREQILEALNGRESGGRLAEKITLMSRKAKTYEVDREVLKKEWVNRSKALGFTPEKIQEAALKMGSEREQGMKINHVNEAIRFLEIQTAVWSKEEMIKTALKSGLVEGLTLKQVENQITRALENKVLVQLAANRFSSKEAIRIEKEIVALVQKQKGNSFAIDAKQINAVIQKFGAYLNEGQQNAVRKITGSRDLVVAVQGYAGVGKTAMVSVASRLWRGQSISVQGLSFTGKAAETLQFQAGIPSQTLHAFLADKESSDRHQAAVRQVWVVDEASMVGNRQMRDLLLAAEKVDAKVVLIGDQYQLQAIDAGKPFQLLQEKGIVETAKMDDILRQKNEGLRKAVEAVAKEKDTDKAIYLFDQLGAIKEIENRESRLITIAQNYLALPIKAQKETLIVTARNRDRLEINQHIREGLKERGQLNEGSEKQYTVTIPKTIQEEDRDRGESYEAGYFIRFPRAHQGMGIIRGESGMVEKIEGQVLKVRMEHSDKTISLDLERYKRFEVYTPEVRQFAHGDQVMFLRNDKNLRVVNGTVGMIVETGDHSLKVETRTGLKEVDLNDYHHIDHSYGSTLHKSQGMTSERVLIHIDTEQAMSNSANAFYVGVSRASHEATIYTDDKEHLPEAVRQWQSKESALDYEKDLQFEYQKGKEPENAQSFEKAYER